MEKKPRPHAELIIAWANGAEIQYRMPESEKWTDADYPAFVENCEYRVKPAREYPESAINGHELHEFLHARNNMDTTHSEDLKELANYVVRHAIDHGQVVTREEFNKVCKDLADFKMALSNPSAFIKAAARPFAPGMVIKVKA